MSCIYRCEIKEHGYFKQKACPICASKAILCNHRTWIKILFNPILRIFGFQIVSVFDSNDKFIKYKFSNK